ncbi:MAG TPA: transcriptional regulator [Tepidisphaeraceae bacterium]|jgi:DNA-binding MarR family transcriptional regulator|nr:transcriptional regulator [Tepidisphaeraceae bacterium]
MSLDSLVANPGRLRILTALAAESRMEFVPLRHATRMTDGNLSCHAKRLHAGGLVAIDKQFRAGKPVTAYRLTDAGRRALRRHVDAVMAAMTPAATVEAEATQDEEWVD